ncbi:MAG TPA: DNA-binding protein [Deltaproteobacteria bacterium]|nr:MAG: DNA-binding protein [Deltaproteobacteria bacterium GWA2_55_82]OGQ65152.1 MAG: DNA-binding protein [Deltaproteobacteria bacterium RIFCSPLOWO2_02_FULL_55_12]OIJ74722.1 MAG: DNA-binding protein [Deltaproteobacteria bacterium GWC2_55_46]HBG45645.1 DNA-binding protein [Deltaproteobacteria bacterium]HCY12162.1 DNA-binding protein [Deltaproteobacteria bacterium]
MSNSMTKSQIEDHISRETGVPKKTVKEIMAKLAELAYREAKNQFTVAGLGKLVLVDRPARTGRNPRTGEEIQIPAKKAVKFRLSKACKDEVLKQAGE